MPENVAQGVALLLYVVSLGFVTYVAFKSKNDLTTSFGVIYAIYSLGFLQQTFQFEYFAVTVNVTFSVADYLRLLLLNCAILAIIVTSEQCSGAKPLGQAHDKIIGGVFLALGLFAFINEARYYGFSDFLLSDKALRFSGGLGSVNNLFIISIDYHLFIIAGAFALSVNTRSQAWRTVYWTLIMIFAAVGYLQGFRYYLAAIFVLVFVVYAKRRFRFGLIMFAGVVVIGLFLAEASKILLSWILYYQWVHEWGFGPYFAMSYTGLIPQEVKAIAANTYLGFNVYADQLHPDLFGYLIKIVPFSERFYDFSSFDQLYATIGQDMNLAPGQGTAFSFFLDSYLSYFIPLLVLWFVLWLTNVHPTPIIKVIVLFFLLNLIRNGFLISISVLKLPLLLYGIIYGLVVLFYAYFRLRPTHHIVHSPSNTTPPSIG